MNKINKYFAGVSLLALSLLSFTSCIDEVEPKSSTATEEQIGRSSSATEALVLAMPAYLNRYTSSAQTVHYQFGYPSIMHARDIMTGDMCVPSTGYDWFSPWSDVKYINQTSARANYNWYYYYTFIQKANQVIAPIDVSTATDEQLEYYGYAKAYRAMLYLDLAQMYEFLSNDKVSSTNSDGHDVLNLTVPIVTDTTSLDKARNNPRVSRTEMAAFILNDLEDAIQYCPATATDKTLPSKACAYGLLARYYMWLGDYPNAETAARNAIDNADVEPISESEALSTTTGYNTLSDFMWGDQLTSSDNLVATGIVNWTSWMTVEYTSGYSFAGAYSMIDKSMYNRISDTDWRKLEWKAPAGSTLDGQNTYCTGIDADDIAEYTTLKFRPGSGNISDNSIACAVAIPLMRVEEMYFIEAEAAAHQDAARGLELLKSFMTTYRDPNYTTTVSSTDDVVEEIVFQKRVELWGEGQTFFDIKRLNYSVTRGYEGTNHHDEARFNTTGRPAWMNLVITQYEGEDNDGVAGYNNPDPTGAYDVWTGE